MDAKLILVILILLVIISVFVIGKINLKYEKYWKYALILLPAVLILLIKLFEKKPQTSGDAGVGNDSAFKQQLGEIKKDMQEAKTVSELKYKYTKENTQEKLKQLNAITSIPDKTERRRRLAAMIG